MDDSLHFDVPSTGDLSRRELEVLGMTARGLTNSQVGAHLNVSVHAVKFHLASVYRKLQVSNRTEATAVYLRSLGADRLRAPGPS